MSGLAIRSKSVGLVKSFFYGHVSPGTSFLVLITARWISILNGIRARVEQLKVEENSREAAKI